MPPEDSNVTIPKRYYRGRLVGASQGPAPQTPVPLPGGPRHRGRTLAQAIDSDIYYDNLLAAGRLPGINMPFAPPIARRFGR